MEQKNFGLKINIVKFAARIFFSPLITMTGSQHTIFTFGTFLSNVHRQSCKVEEMVEYLTSQGIKSVIDLRAILGTLDYGHYPVKVLERSLRKDGIVYYSRTAEMFLFHSAYQKMGFLERQRFARSYCFLPLTGYIDLIPEKNKPIALLFPFWSTLDYKNDGVTGVNLKWMFCRYFKGNRDFPISHIVPRKSETGFDVFDNEFFCRKGDRELLNIREDILVKRDLNTNHWGDFQEYYNRCGEEEWQNMNEESDGSANWNID